MPRPSGFSFRRSPLERNQRYRERYVMVEFDLDRLQALGRLTRKEKFSTEEAKALLLLYREQLEDVMTEAVRQFLREKL